MPSQKTKRKAGNPNWKPGVSGNPKGRPKRGLSLAERVREIVDVDELIAFLDGVWRDTEAKPEIRLAAAKELLDRGHGRSVQAHEIRAELAARVVDDEYVDDLSLLSVEQLRRLAELERERDTLLLEAKPVEVSE